MEWFRKLITSSIGLKAIMAMTGLMLVGFVAFHLQGNLNIYRGPDAMNSYAATMQGLGPLLWIGRFGLISVFSLHILVAFKLAARNRSARPVSYAKKVPIEASLASRTMVLSGCVILFFLLYHLAHFTFLWIGDIGHFVDDQGRHDAYRMIVLGFMNPISSILYIIGNLFLGLHLSHGIQSAFQSLGLRERKYAPLLEKGSRVIGWSLAAGNISMPIAVLFGFVTL
jgi:succinate dehydrogenase / fumarate reductase, cytochrome b subunit